MIRIAMSSDVFPEQWREEAREATRQLLALDPASRKGFIDKKSDLWRQAKPWLEELSHGKCWYCETRVERSDNAVDHFRPKGAVKEDSAHEGYWWLAFDWSNYRFACALCNSFRRSHRGTSGGKHDYFPLHREDTRARSGADDIAQEQPLLLDPTVNGDPDHLWFEMTGRPVASPHFGGADSYPCLRVTVTIRLLHLDEPALCDSRKALRLEVVRELERASTAIALYSEGHINGQDIYIDAHKKLVSMASVNQPLSAVVKCALVELQGEFPFAQTILRSATS